MISKDNYGEEHIFNIVSVGTINQSFADIPNIFKSCLLSNASGKLMGVSCLDHVIIGGQNGATYSMREEKIVDFDPQSGLQRPFPLTNRGLLSRLWTQVRNLKNISISEVRL